MMKSRHRCLFLFFVAVMCVAIAAPAWSAFTVTKRLYIDGAFMGSSTAPALTYTYDRITLANGGNRFGPISYYNCLLGELDEFSIYEGVLNATDVNDHFQAAKTSEAAYASAVASDSPLIYFRLNDANSGPNQPVVPDANVCSVNRYGTYCQAVTQGVGLFGTDKCAVFPGNVPDANLRGCIDLYDGDGSFSHSDISIEVWVKSTALDTDYPRLFHHNDKWTNETAYGAMTDADVNGVTQVGVIGGGSTEFFATTPDINDGFWHQVVVTYESVYEPIGYQNEIPNDNPLIWFRFEEEIASDVNVVNYGSLAVEANYVGADPYFAPGKVGKGVFLHDETDEAIAIFSPDYDGTGGDYSHGYALTPADMSVELWFRCVDWDDGWIEGGELNWFRLYQNCGTHSNKDSVRTYCTYSAYGTGAGMEGDASWGQTYLWTNHPGFDQNADPCQATGVADGDWHHMVATFDINDTEPNLPGIVMQFYIDGALLGTRTQEVNDPCGINAVMGPEYREFLIGTEGSTSGGRWNCFHGTIDEFALYDHILSQERILVHYLEGTAEPGWKPETCAQIYKYGWNKPADKSGNCRIGFEDMKDLGIDWWRCIEPTDDSCEKPWLD